MAKSFYGIDLGTTHTVLVKAVRTSSGYDYECIDLLNYPINSSDPITKTKLLPSVVYYDRDGRAIVGEYAKNAIRFAPERVYFNSKIELGGNYIHLEEIRHTPEDIAAEILGLCYDVILEDSGSADALVKISVPAAFSQDKKQETINAAKKADKYGFFKEKNVSLTEEPYAACLNMIMHEKEFSETMLKTNSANNVMLIDIGGGTMDIITCSFTYANRTFHANFRGKPAEHDEFGGAKFDHKLMERFTADFLNHYHLNKAEIPPHVKDLLDKQFILYAEEAKKFLCTASHGAEKRYSYTPDFHFPDFPLPELEKPFTIDLTKKEMDKVFRPLLSGTKEGKQEYDSIKYYVNLYLQQNQMTTQDIDCIYLTGGMSVYDKVVETVKDTMHKKVILASEPLYCTAKGVAATRQISMETGNCVPVMTSELLRRAEKKEPETTDKTPSEDPEPEQKAVPVSVHITEPNQIGNSYFIDVEGEFPAEIIPKTHHFPCRIEKSDIQLRTTSQSQLYLVIYEGNSAYDSKLKLLKSRKIKFSRLIEAGSAVDIYFKIDENKMITFFGAVAGSNLTEFSVKGDEA